jgi:hypothetical protein
MTAFESTELAPANYDADFTMAEYRKLLRLAASSYLFATYDAIPWGEKFVLWRHDCDYSLNRAIALGRIEHEEGVQATYFVNPHCEFYNLLEASQLAIVKELVRLGHKIGLHFDSMFYITKDKVELESQLASEVRLLEQTIGQRPQAFSFHNPEEFHLSCDADEYAGLVNCYSRRFKMDVPYCSDSNGYWRFRRLRDVLESANDTCLQVLTHPGWWQDKPMRPRDRIARAVHGRAHAVMGFFDKAIEVGGRNNPAGVAPALRFLRTIGHPNYPVLDALMHQGHAELLFLQVFRILQAQVVAVARANIITNWSVSAQERSPWCADCALPDIRRVFMESLGVPLHQAMGVESSAFDEWASLAHNLTMGAVLQGPTSSMKVLAAMESLALWSSARLSFDGFAGEPAFVAVVDDSSR